MLFTLPPYEKYSKPSCGSGRSPSASASFFTRCAHGRRISAGGRGGSLLVSSPRPPPPPPPIMPPPFFSGFSGGAHSGSFTDVPTRSYGSLGVAFFLPLMRREKSLNEIGRRVPAGPKNA